MTNNGICYKSPPLLSSQALCPHEVTQSIVHLNPKLAMSVTKIIVEILKIGEEKNCIDYCSKILMEALIYSYHSHPPSLPVAACLTAIVLVDNEKHKGMTHHFDIEVKHEGLEPNCCDMCNTRIVPLKCGNTPYALCASATLALDNTKGLVCKASLPLYSKKSSSATNTKVKKKVPSSRPRTQRAKIIRPSRERDSKTIAKKSVVVHKKKHVPDLNSCKKLTCHRIFHEFRRAKQKGYSPIEKIHISFTSDPQLLLVQNHVVHTDYSETPHSDFHISRIASLSQNSNFSQVVKEVHQIISESKSPDAILLAHFVAGVAYFQLSMFERAKRNFEICSKITGIQVQLDSMLYECFLGDIEFFSEEFLQSL